MINLFNRLTKKQLLDIFDSFLLNSCFSIVSIQDDCDKVKIGISDNVASFDLYIMIKNLTNSGWIDKPRIKRIQVTRIKDNIIYTNKKRTFMLCGLTKVNEKNILVVWNAYRYLNHNTNRSCYVKDEDLERCYKEGYCMSHEFGQETWLCDESHFNLLVRDYILFNYMG